ncbi:MAG: porin, partial [Solimonas sp.]
MSKLKYAALAVFIGVVATPAMADKAETKGGLKIKTDDGRFEMAIGGRIHFDYYVFSEDDNAAFGSSALTNNGGADFRRTYLTLTGKVYGWKYKFEHDFAADSGAGKTGYREMWVSTNLGPGELVLGQFKPFRGMEELTSSNEITLIERPTTSASGIYRNRQFQMGAGYKGLIADQFGYGAHLVALNAAGGTSEGMGYGARAYWFPIASETQAVHLGLSYSSDREDVGSSEVQAAFNYGGRRGPGQNLARAGAVFNSPVPAGATAVQNGLGEQDTWALELGGAFGPLTAQAEYANASFNDVFGSTAAPRDSDVTAWYVQGSW